MAIKLVPGLLIQNRSPRQNERVVITKFVLHTLASKSLNENELGKFNGEVSDIKHDPFEERVFQNRAHLSVLRTLCPHVLFLLWWRLELLAR